MLHVACRFEPSGLPLPNQPTYDVALNAPYLVVHVNNGIPSLVLDEHQSELSERHELLQHLLNLGVTLASED